MKKIILLTLAAAIVTSASAEGYQVNTLSAKQLGMAHTGVAQKLNSESVWFNPAAAAYQDQKFTIAGGVTGIAAVATWESTDGSSSQKSDNGLSTPLYLNMNYKVNDNLAVGLVANTPCGSSMNWGDSWAGADMVQNISLQAYNVQPTISYKLFDGKLSVGAGLMLSWGSFELSKSVLPVGASSNAYLQYALVSGVMSAYGIDDYTTAAGLVTSELAAIEAVGDNPLASMTLNGKAGLAVGFNVGVMYDINDKWSVGASYRSKMMMSVDSGTTDVNFANDVVKSLLYSTTEVMEMGTFEAELPNPSTLSWGVTYLPNDKWKIAVDMQYVGWSAYESLDINFSYLDDTYNSNDTKSYKDTFIYRIGAEFAATEWLTARAGFYYDESPVPTEYFSPETPSMNKLGYTAGLSLMPCKNNEYFSIDLAYAYIAPAGYNRESTLSSFDGVYRAVANVVSVGLSWGF